MAFKIANRAREHTTSTGTVNVGSVINLGGVTDVGLQTFVAAVGNGNETIACIISGTGDAWIQVFATVADAAPDTLTVTSILASSAGGTNPITLAGTGRAFGIIPFDFSALFDKLFGSTAGHVLTRGASVWAAAAPGGSSFENNFDIDPVADNEYLRYDTAVNKFVPTKEGVFEGVLTIDGEDVPGVGSVGYPTWGRPVDVATAAALPGSPTYNNGVSGVGATLTATVNGALTVDGTTSPLIGVGSRVMVKDQADARHNGIYDITQFGSAGTPYILTRATDQDGSSSFFQQGQIFGVVGGSANSTTLWMFTSDAVAPNPIVIGTNALDFTQQGGTILGALDSISNTPGDQLRRGATNWSGFRPKYVVGASAPGTSTYSASQVIFAHRFACAVTFPDDFAAYLGLSSQAGGSVNATGSTAFTVEKAAAASPNTFSSVGTITFAAGTVTPTFVTSGGALSFAAGDVVRIVAPLTPDATFAGFYCTLVGFEA